MKVQNGHIKRLTDDDLKSVALEIMGVNVATTYITTPIQPRASLAIKLPFLVLIVKNMKKFFSFEVQVNYLCVCVCMCECFCELARILQGFLEFFI